MAVTKLRLCGKQHPEATLVCVVKEIPTSVTLPSQRARADWICRQLPPWKEAHGLLSLTFYPSSIHTSWRILVSPATLNPVL